MIPKQRKALHILLDHSNGIEQLLYGGGAGGGKSWLLCLWLIIVCNLYPGTRWVLGRARLKTLKLTTLKTFYEVCKSMGIKEGVHFKMNRQDHVITWVDGDSEIILMDLFQYPSDPDFDRLGSLEITGAAVDECNQVAYKGIMVLKSRIRYKLNICHKCASEKVGEVIEWRKRESGADYAYKWKCHKGHTTTGLQQKMGMSCNPAKNWVFNEFYNAKQKGKLEEYREFIESLVTDNDKIPEQYVKALGQLDEVSRKRLKHGLWEYSDSLSLFDFVMMQDAFSRRRMVKEGARHFMALDVARLGKDQTVCAICDEEMTVVHLEKFEKIEKGTPEAKRVTKEQAERIRELMEQYDVDEYDIAIDSDGLGGGLADEFELGEHIVNGSKARNGENYQNLRTQLFFKLAQAFNNGWIAFNQISDEQAEKVAEELQPMRREKVEQDGRVCMTNKSQLKELIGRSPDYSDALAYLMVFFIDDLYL